MKHLKKFENEEAKNAWLNGTEYVTPNVALTDGVVEYNLFSYAYVPLFVEAIEDLTVSFSNTYEYSKDNATWQSGTSETIISANAGEKVYFRASGLTLSETGIGQFTISNGKCKVCGNVMSMAYGADFKGKTAITNFRQFYGLFKYNDTIVDASKLALPATILAYNCYGAMFFDCTGLVTAPALPATTLATSCYDHMFCQCTSLVNAPVLPATTLADRCYDNMFTFCTSLVKAPELPATTLTIYCYSEMFSYCSNLNYIKMLATDISAAQCLEQWVEEVSANGTFVKNAAATWDVVGTNGIPEGWTIEYAES